MAHNKPDNCLVQRDGASYVLLRDGLSGLILRDIQGTGGGGISGGTFSRGRWRAMKEEEQRQRQEAIAEREREQKRKAEAKQAAKAKAKAEFKARAQASQDALQAHGEALREQFNQAGAQEAQATAAILEQVRLHAIAAQAEQERERARQAAEAQEHADIERLIQEERDEILRLLHKSGLGALLRTIR